jgi:hypothetical protein
MPTIPPATFAISTAVDGSVRLLGELVLWAVCVTRHLPRDQFAPFVHVVETSLPSELADWLASLGIAVRRAPMPVPGVPHCNRLAAFLDPADVEYIIATDADLFVVRNPADLFDRKDHIKAAPNNACNPPAHIFRRIFTEIGRGWRFRPTMTLMASAAGSRETHINNISAGIVALPRARCKDFAMAWRRWAGWLSERRYLLEKWSGHIDQAAFALACEDVGEDVVFLPAQTNLVLHLLPYVETIYALHISSAHVPSFANRFQDRHLTTEGLSDLAEEGVQRLNECIDEALAAMRGMPSLRESEQTFMNPGWIRP